MYWKVSKLVLFCCAFTPKDTQKRHKIDIYSFRFDISRQNTFICLNLVQFTLKNLRKSENKMAKQQAEAANPASEKLKALQTTLEKLDKAYGKGTVMRLSDTKVMDVPVISTGSLGLDLALGVGGVPRGRVVEIYGPESSGKTTLTMHCIAEAQKAGGLAAFIDAEHAFDKSYAEKLGIDVSQLLISQPDNGEQALEIAEQLISSGAIDICVIDSVAALVPKAELEGDMGDSKMGLQARLMSQALRKLTGVINRTGCCCIFINQLRDKIGVMFGSPETTTGGNALKFYASVRLDIRRIGQIKDGDSVVGNRTRVKVVKNKVAPPFKVVEFDIMYGEGISKAGEVLDLAVDMEIVKKAGSWFSFETNRLGQGRDAVKEMLKDNPELLGILEQRIKDKIKGDETALLDTAEPNIADDGEEE
jgi:recombination protein RecA